MMPSHDDWLDNDIAAMTLTHGEKSGLQLYRNYTESFNEHAIRRFREKLSQERIGLEDFKRLSELLTSEDIRFIPVIVCGYADEVLKAAFSNAIPVDVPGGVRDMLSGYGPLSDLSKRIKMAYAFDIMSQDLMIEVDRVRKVRNRVSHNWDMKAAEELLAHPNLAEMYPIELMLSESWAVDDPLNLEEAFRVRSIWLTGRLTYEGVAYNRAKVARLRPFEALYEGGGTAWLKDVSEICMIATKNVRK